VSEGGGPLRIPAPALVVLVGPSGAGTSTWASAHFPPGHVVSSDALRAVVGEGEHDLRASADAFAVLDQVVAMRLQRKLTTVVDTLGLEPARRAAWIALARRHGLPALAVRFDTPAAVCRQRLRARGRAVPPKVLQGQLDACAALADGAVLAAEGFDAVEAAGPAVVVPQAFWGAAASAARQGEDPVALRFGLQVPSFTWDGGPAELGARLRTIARTAEEVGFDSLWVMDHFRQIPSVGPAWHDMLDSWTTLGFVAGATSRIRLGTMVTGVTYRNVAHLGKIAASLDVLSGGRAICGIGAAWFGAEHAAYGWDFPAVADRFALLEDALELLPLLWGPGAPAYRGRVISVPEAMCYPRPLQERIPILVGGSGERRTLRLVARHADACNLFGDADVVRRKVGVLHDWCAVEGRDPAAIEVTQLSTVLVGRSRASLAEAVDALRPPSVPAERYAATVNAGTVDDHVGRFRDLADAGVQAAVVSFPDLGAADLDPAEPLARFAAVIDAFRA
jgi:F420-dependent oxidoreductase-like protein